MGCNEGACEEVLDGEGDDFGNFAEGACEGLEDRGEEGANVGVESGESGKAEG